MSATVSHIASTEAYLASVSATPISRGQKAAATRLLNTAATNQARIKSVQEQEARTDAAAILTPVKPSVAPKLLTALHNAIVADVKSDFAVMTAFIAAGKDQANVIRQFYASRLVATKVCKTLERALLVVTPTKEGGLAAVPKAGVEVSDKHMTLAEEKGFGAARGKLTADRKRWNIPTTSTQGGDRTKAAGDNEEPMNFEKVATPKRTGIVTDMELATYVQAMATSLYSACLLNKTHEAITTDLGAQIMGACADFEAAIKDIVNAHA